MSSEKKAKESFRRISFVCQRIKKIHNIDSVVLFLICTVSNSEGRVIVIAAGNFHQGNMHQYQHHSTDGPCHHDITTAEVQCVVNSIAALGLAQMKPLASWTASDLNTIL